MAAFLVRRALALIPVLIGVGTIVFLILQLTPGDPAVMMLGDAATKESVELLREEMGLNEPLLVQYGIFVGNLVQLDLGNSIAQRQPVMKLIGQRLIATAELAFLAMLIAVVLGVTLGTIAAVYRNTIIDYAVTTISLFGISAPVFYIGMLLILFFSLHLGVLPASGRGPDLFASIGTLFKGNAQPLVDSLRHLALPALTLGLSFSALMAKMTRATMLEVLQQDYIRTARAKGVGQRQVIYKHGFRNASIPLLTILGLQFSGLLGGAVLTETIFAWPGLGRLAVDAIWARDFPVVQGAVLTVAVIFVVLNIVVDLMYGLLDPRITYA